MRGEASCDAPALCPAADLLVPSSDAAEAGVPFERLALVRHELDSYRAACSANGFDAHLASYRRLYNRTLDPSVADARVLVVRDSIARRDRGIGQQTPFLLKWLLIGFALQRPVYFQYCATEAEPWAEPEVRHRTGRRYGPMHCDQVHYDLGDYFGLLGGVDVRWRPHLHAAAMRRRGLRQTVVGACSLDERRPAPGSDGEEADTWLFLCRPALLLGGSPSSRRPRPCQSHHLLAPHPYRHNPQSNDVKRPSRGCSDGSASGIPCTPSSGASDPR